MSAVLLGLMVVWPLTVGAQMLMNHGWLEQATHMRDSSVIWIAVGLIALLVAALCWGALTWLSWLGPTVSAVFALVFGMLSSFSHGVLFELSGVFPGRLQTILLRTVYGAPMLVLGAMLLALGLAGYLFTRAPRR